VISFKILHYNTKKILAENGFKVTNFAFEKNVEIICWHIDRIEWEFK
jgi:hypothetical protein